MRILKRNNEATKFEQSKIENAILKAMKYGSGVYDEELAKKIAIEIKEECEVASLFLFKILIFFPPSYMFMLLSVKKYTDYIYTQLKKIHSIFL